MVVRVAGVWYKFLFLLLTVTYLFAFDCLDRVSIYPSVSQH